MRNILGHCRYDSWKVTTDAQYYEDGPADDTQTPGVGLGIPQRVRST